MKINNCKQHQLSIIKADKKQRMNQLPHCNHSSTYPMNVWVCTYYINDKNSVLCICAIAVHISSEKIIHVLVLSYTVGSALVKCNLLNHAWIASRCTNVIRTIKQISLCFVFSYHWFVPETQKINQLKSALGKQWTV